jgi:phytanoyl-CoA hydroxylase
MSDLPVFRAGDADLETYYRDNGFVVVDALWAVSECDSVVDIANAFPRPSKTDFRPLMQPQRLSPGFLSTIRKQEIVRLVEQLLEGRASGLQIEFFFGHPGTRGFARHQDNFYVEAGSEAFLSVWSAMTDVTPGMGGLVVYPGSHRFGRLPTRKLLRDAGPNQDPNSNNEETILPDSISQAGIQVSVPKGGVVFLHGDIVHASLTNESERFRYALLCTYLRQGTAFRPGRSAKREEIELHDTAAATA